MMPFRDSLYNSPSEKKQSTILLLRVTQVIWSDIDIKCVRTVIPMLPKLHGVLPLLLYRRQISHQSEQGGERFLMSIQNISDLGRHLLGIYIDNWKMLESSTLCCLQPPETKTLVGTPNAQFD